MKKRGLFSKVFPTPHFMSLEAIGIEITPTAMRFVSLTDIPGRVEYFGENKFSTSPYNAELGLIENHQELYSALRDVRKITHYEHVVLSVPDEKGYLYELDNVSEKDSEMRTAVELSVEENVPFPLAEVRVSYERIPETTSVVVTVVESSFVENAHKVLHQAGLNALGYDLQSRAIARLTVPGGKSLKEGSVATCLQLYLANDKATVSLVSDGVQRLAYTIHEESLESLLKGEDEATQADEELQQTSALRVVAAAFKKAVDYYNLKSDKPLESPIPVMICSEEPLEKNFTSLLSERTGVTTAFIDPWRVLSDKNYIPSISADEVGKYLVALGLAAKPFIDRQR